MINLQYTAEEASPGGPPANPSPIPAEGFGTARRQGPNVRVPLNFVGVPLQSRPGSRGVWEEEVGVGRGTQRRRPGPCGWNCLYASYRRSSSSSPSWLTLAADLGWRTSG